MCCCFSIYRVAFTLKPLLPSMPFGFVHVPRQLSELPTCRQAVLHHNGLRLGSCCRTISLKDVKLKKRTFIAVIKNQFILLLNNAAFTRKIRPTKEFAFKFTKKSHYGTISINSSYCKFPVMLSWLTCWEFH